jgi:hypothetical protein
VHWTCSEQVEDVVEGAGEGDFLTVFEAEAGDLRVLGLAMGRTAVDAVG